MALQTEHEKERNAVPVRAGYDLCKTVKNQYENMPEPELVVAKETDLWGMETIKKDEEKDEEVEPPSTL